jgi:hypothetical protein
MEETAPPPTIAPKKTTRRRTARQPDYDIPAPPGFSSWDDYNQAMQAYKQRVASEEPEKNS